MKSQVTLLVVASLLLAHALHAQEKRVAREQERGQVVGLSAGLVELDMAVSDAAGRPISDLKPEEVTIYENGVRQEIVAFERISGGVRTNLFGESHRKTEKSRQSSTESGPLRYSLIFMSLTSDDRLFLSGRREKLFEAINELIGPSDRVAIAMPDGLVQDFTNDRELIHRALATILSQEKFSGTLAQTLASGRSAAADGSASLSDLLAQQELSPIEEPANVPGYMEHLRRVFLQDLIKVVRGLSLLPGRKQFIWFNSGFMLEIFNRQGPAMPVDTQTLFLTSDVFFLERLIEVANRGGVSFYVIDARGVKAPFGARKVDPGNPGALFDQLSAITRSEYASRILASATGGRFYGLNWSEEGIRWVARDAHNYYRLAYYPTNTARDGKFRRIEVKVRRKGVTVLARAGYMAPKEFRAMTEAERRDELVEALLSEKAYRTLPTLAQGYVFPQEKEEGFVSVVVEVEGATIPVRFEEGRYRVNVEIALQVLTLAGEPKKSLQRTISLNLLPSSFEELRRRCLRYTADVKLPPGEYRLRVVARENETGQLGSAVETIIVPHPKSDRLQLSDIVLCVSENQQESSEATPFQVGSIRLIPSASRRFRTSSDVKMYMQFRMPPPATSHQLEWDVTYQIIKAGEIVAQSREITARPGVVSQPMPWVSRLLVEEMTPGQYELVVTVTDRMTGQTESRRTQFRIEAS